MSFVTHSQAKYKFLLYEICVAKNAFPSIFIGCCITKNLLLQNLTENIREFLDVNPHENASNLKVMCEKG